MKRLISLFLLVACLSTEAATQGGEVTALGYGVVSCGKLVTVYDQKNAVHKVAIGSWLAGYLTGINDGLHGISDITGGAEQEALELWIYNYCKENPLDSIYDASHALVHELKARH